MGIIYQLVPKVYISLATLFKILYIISIMLRGYVYQVRYLNSTNRIKINNSKINVYG